ncbi:hypothetical protein AK812_SmicGene24164 [Symbiodinium microadriaticum]|uniref:Uncharacterized protein n=1 Tax=Symbiodinium microadriaticum TaxID=2951 RepID=A0A1Q9DFD4_SYMMI|nr:hypothetical protein AK812_SmicGene24164 [Symbiodinium microadriaticum]
MYIYFRHKDDCEYLWDLFEAHDAMAHSIADVVATSPSDYREMLLPTERLWVQQLDEDYRSVPDFQHLPPSKLLHRASMSFLTGDGNDTRPSVGPEEIWHDGRCLPTELMSRDLLCRLTHAQFLFSRWPGGYSAATDPAAATLATPPKAAVGKTKASAKSSLRGRGISNVEKYSSSYASLAQMPVARPIHVGLEFSIIALFPLSVLVGAHGFVPIPAKTGHLADWLHHILPDTFNVVYCNRLSRDEVLAFVYIATGLSPQDRVPSPLAWSYFVYGICVLQLGEGLLAWLTQLLPRYIKSECLEAVAAEYQRLGSPLTGVDIAPEDAVAQVIEHLSQSHDNGADATDGSGARPSHGAEGPGSSGLDTDPFAYYTANFVENTWFLNAFQAGELVASAALPFPGPADDPSIWQIIIQEGVPYVWTGRTDDDPIPCAQYIQDDFSDYEEEEEESPVIVVLDSLSNQQALRYSGMEVELPTSGGNWKVVRDGKSKDWLVVDTKGRTKLAKALIGLKRARKRIVAPPESSKPDNDQEQEENAAPSTPPENPKSPVVPKAPESAKAGASESTAPSTKAGTKAPAKTPPASVLAKTATVVTPPPAKTANAKGVLGGAGGYHARLRVRDSKAVDPYALYSEDTFAAAFRSFSKSMSNAVYATRLHSLGSLGTEVMSRQLNHSLSVAANITLSDFMALPPSMERPLLVAALSLVLCANEEYAIRALVCDEEASGFRMLNLLNALNGSLLKATLLVNHYRGPFATKKNRYTLQEGAKLLVETCTDEWLEDLQEAYQYDCRDAAATLTREHILESPGVYTRLPARNKAWFGILESFASLTRSWTVLSNVTEFVSEYISAMEAADEAQQDSDHEMMHSDDDAIDEAEAGNVDAADEEEPQTRAAFNLLRSSYNSDAALVRDLYKEPLLQQKIRLICYDLQDLHHEYSSGLKKCSQEDTMRACADRAAYSWFSTVQAMMHRLGGSGLVDELKLFPRVPRHSTARPRSPDDEAIQDDRALVRLHFALLVELSANRCWSQTFYGFCFPYLVATVYCEDEFARARGAALMTRVCKAILKLEEFVSDNPMHATACALLESIATHKWQVTREIFVMGANTNWTWDDDELRATAWAMFSGPMTTKSTLESAFNHLRDKGARHSRNQKMSLETRYSYLATQPYARGDTGGVAQVRPTADDFTTLAREAAARDAIYSLKPFKPTATKMPQTYPHPLDIARKWRPAGFHANRVAAAAVALATSTAARTKEGKREGGGEWGGEAGERYRCFMTKGETFHHKTDDRFILSLGFHRWAFQALRLVAWESMSGEVWLQPDTKQSGPLLIANLSLDPEWEFVPTEALPACCMPADMPYDASCMLKVTGPAEPILMAALRRGARLTLYQLKAIVVAFSIAVPAQGSGKGGRCIKIDFIRAVLAHFFATEMTPEQQAETASKILGKKPADSPETDTPELHLKLLAQLDASEAPQFAVMKKVAVDALAEEALKAKVKKPGKAKATEHVPTADDIAEAEAAETVEKEKPTFETRASGTHVKAPREFRSLLPPNLDYIYFHWVFAFTERAYHARYPDTEGYDSSFKAPSDDVLRARLLEMEARLELQG